MAGSFQSQYKTVDDAVARLSKIDEYLDLGYSTSLEIALDIEESNTSGENSSEVEDLKEITLKYAQMEEELKQWLKAAELTKAAFIKEYSNVNDDRVPSIEDILMSKLNETDENEQDFQKHPKVEEFTKQVWSINHSGEPLPNAAANDTIDSDIIIAGASEESVICPLTQKQMVEPVRSKKCRHSYEKAAIIQHLRARNNQVRCPVGGCASFVTDADLEPNSSLAFRIKRLQRKALRKS